jgi:hypothetical protein
MYRPTEAEIRHLSDTPLNRRLIQRWADQDQRGLLLQRTLFSGTVEPDPETPTKEAPRNFSETAEVTFRIHEEDPEGPSLELSDQTFIDRAIVSRMVAGSSRSRTCSATDISQIMFSTINILVEFPKVYEQKKNKCATVISFVAWLIKNEHFTWPVDETGDALRDVLSGLSTGLMAEFLAPPKLVAAVQMAALFVSKFHSSVFISDFHTGLCHQDTDFNKFKDDCARGLSDDSVLKFIHPGVLPGFERLTGAHSAEYWVDTATAIIDSASFLDIVKLEAVYNNNLVKWQEFQIGAKQPKISQKH